MLLKFSLLTLLGLAVLSLDDVAYAADPVPPGTGCCFSFERSPVNIVFCTTAGACRFEQPPKAVT